MEQKERAFLRQQEEEEADRRRKRQAPKAMLYVDGCPGRRAAVLGVQVQRRRRPLHLSVLAGEVTLVDGGVDGGGGPALDRW